MSVWLTIPSAKPKPEAQACVEAWRKQGYRVALWRDSEAEALDCDFLLIGQYPGYPRACNALIQELLVREPEARWFIAAGDDMLPDQTKRADDIAAECEIHFHEHWYSVTTPISAPILVRGIPLEDLATFGVMQPTGDGYGAEHIAGSAWIGRKWCETMYNGQGPLWHEYTHNFVDNELMEVAKLTGTFWQRPDLTHRHNHWGRIGKPMPRYLAEANSPQHWERFMRLYQNRKAMKFPGHEPIFGEVAA